MFKKHLATAMVFLATIPSAFAAGSFYIGPGLTYTDFKTDDLTYAATLPTLYAGYGGWAREWLYFALEGFVSSNSIGIKDQQENEVLKTEYSYGISVIPMVNLDDVVFAFLRLGYVQTKFKEVSDISGSYMLGAGLETNVSGCWYLRGEFDYIPYGSTQPFGSIHSTQAVLSAIYRFESLL